jgi:hypothetical protein
MCSLHNLLSLNLGNRPHVAPRAIEQVTCNDPDAILLQWNKIHSQRAKVILYSNAHLDLMFKVKGNFSLWS